VTVEEHQIIGGLAGAVAESLGRTQPAPIENVGMPNHFGESGEPDQLLEKYGMKATHVVAAVKRVMKRK
jgi:transketolase